MTDSRGTVLVVDDEPSVRAFIERLLLSEGFRVVTAGDVATGLVALEQGDVDLVVCDKNLPDGNGHDVTKRAAEMRCGAIMMTAFASLSSAVEALQQGVGDYIQKPIGDLDDFLARITRVLHTVELERANARLLAELQKKNVVLEAMAVRDPLTGLFNHAYFQESLERELHRGARNQHDVSLIFLDVDQFKEINDTLGHQAGDKLLKMFADLLLGTSRRSDMSFRLRTQDVAARYGGDEFAVILPETPKRGAAVKAERLRRAVLDLPFTERGLPAVSVSLGVASFPEDAGERAALIEAADSGLYAAKSLGKNRLVTYSAQIARTQLNQAKLIAVEAERLEARERSLARGAFDFVYQPVVDIATGTPVAYEALCRPTDPAFASPADLIDVAERAGRVIDLGRTLRRRAAAALARLPSDVSLLINLHPHELNDPSLLDGEPELRGAASRVIFELTETASITNAARTRTCLDRLRAHGFRIALADLSSGYASLESVILFEPELVKLNASVLAGIGTSSRTARLLRHFVEHASDEKVRVIVQAIETEEQRDAARSLGFTLMQGFLLGKPAPLG
jgi:diguanylate cyclase (GGDEF)-like protein